MSKVEKRIAAAEARREKAQAALRLIRTRQDAAIEAARSRFAAAVEKALRDLRHAKVAVAEAELLRAGIIPMHTVIVQLGRHYAVRITSEGWTRKVPLTKDLRIHRGRNEDFFSATYMRFTLTDKVMVQE